MSDRSSIRSGSSLGGYETPDEELPAGRSVRFVSIEEEREFADANNVTDDIIDKKTYRYMKRPKLGKGLLARVFRRFPRCYAFWMGMVFPLWSLVLLSLIGGKILADFEFEGEVQANNDAMRLRLLEERYNSLVDLFEQYAPAFCHIHYNNGVPAENLTASWTYLLDTETSLIEFIEREQEKMIEEGTFSIQNITSFSKYLSVCGKIVDNYTDALQQDFVGGYDDSRSLSFNWIRCVNVSWTTPIGFNRIFQPTQDYIDAAHPANQSKAFSDAWRESQLEITDSYINLNEHEENAGIREVRLKAFNYSIYEATGGTSCAVNVPSAAWFWFTVMATVGYGNQSPVTAAGRALVFTFGFLSILCFGAVLATSGTITTHLVQDFVIRLRFRILANKVVMMIVWGLLWIVELLFIAGHSMRWRIWRLDETLAMEDAFWFAYISTTTIGLGDFYPAPEEMFIVDLLVYTLLFLLGFVLLSSFLTELSYLLGGLFPDTGTELAKRLKFVGILPCKGRLHGPRKDFESDMDFSSSSVFEPEIPALPTAPFKNGLSADKGKENGELNTVETM